MDIETMKQLIKKYEPGHAAFVTRAAVAERYYRNETDILFRDKPKDKGKEESDNPLRNADNRIPRNFHGLIVNQKASYAFTAPPLFDVGNTAANKHITKALGDEYAKNCMELCVNAANTSIGWVHYWQGDSGFEWAVVPSEQVIPVFDRSLKRRLIGAMRVYPDIDDATGDNYTVYEYWTDTECQAFRRRVGETLGIDTDKEEIFHEVGHLIENYMMDQDAVRKYKEFLVDGLTYSDIITKTYYNSVGKSVDIYILKGSRFESEYQARLYINKTSEALKPDGTINVDLLGESISEAFRKYMNNEIVSDEVKKMIEGVVL